MDKFLFSFFISFLFLQFSFAQDNFELTFGLGLNVNNHFESYYDGNLQEPSVVRNNSIYTTSLGLNLNVDYTLNKFLKVRTGLQYYKVNYDVSPVENTHSIIMPLMLGLTWQRARLYSGISYERTFFSFLTSLPSQGEIEVNRENCNCTLQSDHYNFPLTLEFLVSKKILIGYTAQLSLKEKVNTFFRKDEVRNSYLYINYIF